MLLLELFFYALLAVAMGRLLPQPWKDRASNVLKVWLTARILWLLAVHQVPMPDGTQVVGWRLVVDQLAQIDAGTFWIFVLLGTLIRTSGVIASMLRWQLLLKGQAIELPFRHIFGSFLIGRAIGFFLPSTAGLDAYKLYDASRFSGKTVEVTAATVLEKVLGVSGIFLSFLVALPFGIRIFGENGPAIAAFTVPICLGIISALLVVLWYPGLVQWLLEMIPIPGKQRLEGVVIRISNAAAAYRNKRGLVLTVLFLSFIVHFTTAAMYYFMALAIGAGANADFWPIAFGSSIQIFATVASPFTIGGMGIREAAQYAVLGNMIGPAIAIISAHLGFWVGEFPTLFGFLFWVRRGSSYRPAFCRVDGQQVDYEEAAKNAISLETEEEKAKREGAAGAENLAPLGSRVLTNAGLGLGTGIIAGLLIGIVETIVIAQGGFGGEAQVMWYGPLAYATVLGGLALVGGAVLGILPMGDKEAAGWTPSLGMLATLVPFGLAITMFRLRRDVYLEQMPPAPVLLAVVAGFGVLALIFFFGGRRIFGSPLGRVVRPIPAFASLAVVTIAGLVGASLTVGGGGERSQPPAVPAALQDRPNIILVMVDTLRADHLSCYGMEGIETPNICGLGQNGGSTFTGFSHASWTKPSTASLLTSLLPSSHKAMSKVAALSPDVEHVAEVLQQHGYATGGIASNINLAPSFGFDQGYDEYHYLGPDYLAFAKESSSKIILYQIARSVWFKIKPGLRFGDFYQDSEVVNEMAFDFIDRHKDSRFFLFLHYMDPHDPYFEHPYNGNAVARVSTPHPEADQAEELRELYKGEIEYLDGNFGKLLARLDALGIGEDTMIVLTADHGEEFHEQGGWWHGLTLYENQIHVPLLIRWPKNSTRPSSEREKVIARHIDVVPTLIARAGAKAPASMQGVDLVGAPSLLQAKDRQVYSEEDHEGNVLWSLRTETEKLIVANPGNPRGLPERAYFDIAKDEHERSNLSGPDMAYAEGVLEEQANAQRLFAESDAIEGGEQVEMTKAECEQLRLLGYVEDCDHIQN